MPNGMLNWAVFHACVLFALFLAMAVLRIDWDLMATVVAGYVAGAALVHYHSRGKR